MCIDCLLVMTSGVLFAAGAGLIAITHRPKGSDAAGRRLDWVNYNVYLALVSLLVALGAAQVTILKPARQRPGCHSDSGKKEARAAGQSACAATTLLGFAPRAALYHPYRVVWANHG